jgi:hypothetical protein
VSVASFGSPDEPNSVSYRIRDRLVLVIAQQAAPFEGLPPLRQLPSHPQSPRQITTCRRAEPQDVVRGLWRVRAGR